MLETIIKTGEIAISKNRIRTNGVGSCIVVVFLDKRLHTAGMAHAMLPERLGHDFNYEDTPAKYVNEAVDELLARFLNQGSEYNDIVAMLAGGAEMFSSTNTGSDSVSSRNTQTARRCLNEIGVPIVRENTGGHYGRTVEIDPNESEVTITTRNPKAPFALKKFKLI